MWHWSGAFGIFLQQDKNENWNQRKSHGPSQRTLQGKVIISKSQKLNLLFKIFSITLIMSHKVIYIESVKIFKNQISSKYYLLPTLLNVLWFIYIRSTVYLAHKYSKIISWARITNFYHFPKFYRSKSTKTALETCNYAHVRITDCSWRSHRCRILTGFSLTIIVWSTLGGV